MMRMLALLLLLTHAAEGAENYTQYLVPITGETIAGANGSQWTGELTLFNGSGSDALLVGKFRPHWLLTPPGGDAVMLERRTTEKPLLYGSGSTAGAFLYVPKALEASLRMSLRIRDLSRNANSWGTEIPIVSQEEIGDAITLIDVPTDPQYRATLRVYFWTDFGNLPARVRVYAPDRAEPVSQFVVTGHAPFPHDPDTDMPFYPAYAQVDLLTPEVRAAGPTIRVEVDVTDSRQSPPLPGIWAFVSVTNNETQQVTVMTP